VRALGLFARRPLTGCSLPPRCRISLPRAVTTRFNLTQILGFVPWQDVRKCAVVPVALAHERDHHP
jgi:hypothetical protein